MSQTNTDDLLPRVNELLTLLADHNAADGIAILNACISHIFTFCVECGAFAREELHQHIQDMADVIENSVITALEKKQAQLELN